MVSLCARRYRELAGQMGGLPPSTFLCLPAWLGAGRFVVPVRFWAMDVDELRRAIRKKHGDDLERFRALFLGPEGRTNGENSSNPLERKMPMMGHRALTDRHVDLTVSADVVDTGWFFENPDLEGSCATVSFAGHHRQLGTRVSLPSGECDAWASEIVGDQWAAYLYRAGTLSGVSGTGRLSTVYYRVFLDGTGDPVMKPEAIVHEQLRHISEL